MLVKSGEVRIRRIGYLPLPPPSAVPTKKADGAYYPTCSGITSFAKTMDCPAPNTRCDIVSRLSESWPAARVVKHAAPRGIELEASMDGYILSCVCACGNPSFIPDVLS
jgi:hypothetical protein